MLSWKSCAQPTLRRWWEHPSTPVVQAQFHSVCEETEHVGRGGEPKMTSKFVLGVTGRVKQAFSESLPGLQLPLTSGGYGERTALRLRATKW